MTSQVVVTVVLKVYSLCSNWFHFPYGAVKWLSNLLICCFILSNHTFAERIGKEG